MRYFLSGGNCEEQYYRAKRWLEWNGHEVISPFDLVLPKKIKPCEIVKLHNVMIEVCDGIYMLTGWQELTSAKEELQYAKSLEKKIKYEDKQRIFKKTTEIPAIRNDSEQIELIFKKK